MLYEWILKIKIFTTDTGKLRVKKDTECSALVQVDSWTLNSACFIMIVEVLNSDLMDARIGKVDLQCITEIHS